ncbi:MAG TPA: hypothetical protein VM820_01750, partial [Vicinamibacterales bacterium]|nr:hypothetical protein [Vicinamibacterales bacterium]
PPRRDSPPPRFSAEERELLLRELRRVESRVDEIARASAEGRALAQDVRDLTNDFRDLAREFRDTLARDAAQERFLGHLNAQVQSLAAQAGRDAGGAAGGLLGGVEGREAARDVTKNSGAKATVIAVVISAFTAGAVQGLAEAFKPKPSHIQPPAHLIKP